VGSLRKAEKRLLQREKHYERFQLMRVKRPEERRVIEEVFDRSTLLSIHHLARRGIIKEFGGVVDTGKESRVYWGLGKDGKEVAIKIFLTTSAEFKKGMLPYIKGNHRFARVRHTTRGLIYAWALKEYKNLKKAYENGVHVPKPIAIKNNVLIMEFIGKNRSPAPLMKDVILECPEAIYYTLLRDVKKLYRESGLVHGDLSPYNVMMWRNKPVIFDVSQAVPVRHPMASELLRRDIRNLNNYFAKLGVKVRALEEILEWIKKNE